MVSDHCHHGDRTGQGRHRVEHPNRTQRDPVLRGTLRRRTPSNPRCCRCPGIQHRHRRRMSNSKSKGKPLMTVDYRDLQIDGVRVETYGVPSAAPPLLFVHGGCQGSWAWENMAPRLAGAGWYAVCLNWFGHYGSRVLPDGRRGEPLASQRHNGNRPGNGLARPRTRPGSTQHGWRAESGLRQREPSHRLDTARPGPSRWIRRRAHRSCSRSSSYVVATRAHDRRHMVG